MSATMLEKPAPAARLSVLRRALRQLADDLDAVADAVAEFDGGEDALESILEDIEDVAARARDAAYGARPIPLEAVKAVEAGENPIAAMRRARGLTQAELAEAAGFSAIYISKLERGEKKLAPETAEALALALNCWPENLYDE